MYGLHFRETLPQVVADELDGLVAALRGIFYKEHSEDGSHLDAAPEAALVPVGSIIGWLTTTAPDRWLLCNGAAVSRITYRALFTVIGITYGSGDGVLTFNLPNLSGRVLLGKATSGTGSTLGAVGGSIDHTHTGGTTGSNGAHTHTVSSHLHSVDIDTGTSGSTQLFYEPGASSVDVVGGHNHAVEGNTGNQNPGTDSQGAHTHSVPTTGASNPPFIVANYIVFAGGSL